MLIILKRILQVGGSDSNICFPYDNVLTNRLETFKMCLDNGKNAEDCDRKTSENCYFSDTNTLSPNEIVSLFTGTNTNKLNEENYKQIKEAILSTKGSIKNAEERLKDPEVVKFFEEHKIQHLFKKVYFNLLMDSIKNINEFTDKFENIDDQSFLHQKK